MRGFINRDSLVHIHSSIPSTAIGRRVHSDIPGRLQQRRLFRAVSHVTRQGREGPHLRLEGTGRQGHDQHGGQDSFSQWETQAVLCGGVSGK